MKILHLVAGELNGGAGRGAYWLHQGLRDLGVESTILTNAKEDLGDGSVISLTDSAFGKLKFSILYRLGQLPLQLYRKRQPSIFSTGFSGVDITRHSAYRASDLVHLHWVNGLVRTRSLRNINKPVVWTLRDMWPFTGGCHHSLGCDRFTGSCGRCPQLESSRDHDLTRYVLRHKERSLPENLCIVGISQWMSECARRSALFRSRRVTTISNNIDTQQFFPVSKKFARQALGLDDNKKIVLAGAQDVASVYKGFDLFLEATKHLPKEDVQVVLFGNVDSGVKESFSVPSTTLGYLSDAVALRLAYSAADVFVAPSRVDAFGKTIVEAMSCGTPAVCFNATGPRDIIKHKESGYLAEPFNAQDLSQGIQWVLNLSPDAYAESCQAARLRAQHLFDSRVIAKAYMALYQDMLKSAAA
jgi:glycosyltransferase involved in cell wall biosynthesis